MTMSIMETTMLRYIIVIFLAAGIVQGLEETDPDTRIVGGSDAADGEFPHQVSLRLKARNFHFCGGSIIAPKWILTATHCTNNNKPGEIVVVVGTNTLNSGGDKYQVAIIKNHENYNKTSFANDISVVGLDKEIKYGDKVGEIPLASKNTPGGVELITSGWGYLNSYRKRTNKLQKLTVNSLSVKDCQNSGLKSFVNRNPITENHICTFKKVDKGICQGDSGGPLVENGEVVGITSWNIPCARGRPDVFTRVFKYLDWIKEHISE